MNLLRKLTHSEAVKKDPPVVKESDTELDIGVIWSEQPEFQNGHSKPSAGTKIRMIWGVADELTAKLGMPAQCKEVLDVYQKVMPHGSIATVSTQYHKWSAFRGVRCEFRKHKVFLRTKSSL